ncbi:MAG: hypothetical protein NZ929_02610 [Aigarchaeota archaeon]|nr:hypothetical protein [Aigarchaeota archaeon]
MVKAFQNGYSVYEAFDSLVENIMTSSRKLLEVAALISRDLSILAIRIDEEEDTYLENFEAASGITMSFFNILRSIDFGVPGKIRIQFNNKRSLIVEPYMDYFIVCLTKPNVRIGFVELILEYYRSATSETPTHKQIITEQVTYESI